MPINKTKLHQEEARILNAYAKRQYRDLSDFFGYESMAHVLRIQERYRETLRLLSSFGFFSLTKIRILDIGCGDGNILRQFLEWGAKPKNLAGIELRTDAVQKALEINPLLCIHCGSATQLPWTNERFDLVCQHTVFTSILEPEMKRQIAIEMTRVLKPRGAILWYDFLYNNPRNPDVRGIKLDEIRVLFPDLLVKIRKITLAPPIARRIPEFCLPGLYPLLSAIPLLRTHYLGLFIKR